MNYSLRKSVALLFSIFTILLTACSDESPVEFATDNIEEVADEVERHAYDEAQELERESKSSSSSQSLYSQCTSNYNSTCCNSCYSDYGYYNCEYCTNSCYDNYGNYVCGISSSSSYYYSSSYYSSSSSLSKYTTKAMTMIFTLTYYKQITVNWDGLDDPGDPEISFTLKTYTDGTLMQTLSTGLLLNKSDVTSWSGTSSKTLSIAAGIDQILVTPKVVDEDVLSDDNYSSGYSYYAYNVGYLDNYETVEQSDYKSSDYTLKWEWYLY